MSKSVVYICDGCRREYPYCLTAEDKDRQILVKVGKFDLCRSCLKRIEEIIKSGTFAYRDTK